VAPTSGVAFALTKFFALIGRLTSRQTLDGNSGYPRQ
jgi:hypothetical protein